MVALFSFTSRIFNDNGKETREREKERGKCDARNCYSGSLKTAALARADIIRRVANPSGELYCAWKRTTSARARRAAPHTRAVRRAGNRKPVDIKLLQSRLVGWAGSGRTRGYDD